MVNREAALQKLWRDRCKIVVRKEQIDPFTKLTDFVESVLCEGEPCKLSFSALSVSGGGHIAVAEQNVKLFITSSLFVPAGSKIIVKRGEREFIFGSSGEPAVFTYHQEVALEKFRGWA